MTGLTIHVFLPEPGTSRSDLEVRVRAATGHGDLVTIWSAGLYGVETDFLGTLVNEVTLSWAYGERIRDVILAATGVLRQARGHRRRHEY